MSTRRRRLPVVLSSGAYTAALYWCADQKVKIEWVLEKNRWKQLKRGVHRVAARHAMWVYLREKGFSFPEIASLHGCESHVAVLEACRKMRSRQGEQERASA